MVIVAAALLFALAVWWAAKLAIIWLDGLPRRTFRTSFAIMSLAALAGLWGVHATAHDASRAGAFCAFTSALLVWGWQEVGFYMGFVTGPRRTPRDTASRGWVHFVQAAQTSLWHELTTIASAALVAALAWHAPNQTGTWTFVILWAMHLSAKLNVFLGVRNLHEEFLPDHLAYLATYLTRKPMNPLFPVSIAVSAAITAGLARGALAGDAGEALLAGLMALGIFEHLLLVLPLPARHIWGAGLKSRTRKPSGIRIATVFASPQAA